MWYKDATVVTLVTIYTLEGTEKNCIKHPSSNFPSQGYSVPRHGGDIIVP